MRRRWYKALRHDLGERAHYVDYGQGTKLQSIDIVINPYLGYAYINNEVKNEIKKEKMKKRRILKKGGGIINEDKEDSFSKNSEEKKKIYF